MPSSAPGTTARRSWWPRPALRRTELNQRSPGLVHRVLHRQRRVVGEAFGVPGSPIHLDRAGQLGQLRGGDLVVDAPSGVVVIRLPAPGPPGVRAGPLAAEAAAQVHPAFGEPVIEVGPFIREESGGLPIALPVLDVHLAVDD